MTLLCSTNAFVTVIEKDKSLDTLTPRSLPKGIAVILIFAT